MRCVIVGGGAAGLACACELSAAGIDTVILEKQNRVGRKLLSTGNGRCNFSNLNAGTGNYHGDRKTIGKVLERFAPKDAIIFFEKLGVESTVDEEGRVYPLSNQAAGVLDALRMYATEHHCEIRTEFEVQDIRRKGKRFELISKDGATENADRVIIACGGLAAPKLGGCPDGYRILQKFGHSTTPRYPAIVALKTEADRVRGLKGIRMHGSMELISAGKTVRRETGEILFADAGVSGIAAMQMARDVNLLTAAKKKCVLKIRLLEKADPEYLKKRLAIMPDRALEDILSGIMPKRLGQCILNAAKVGPMTRTAGSLSDNEIGTISRLLRAWEIPVTGTLSFEQAQVTCGGVPLNEFDPATLESVKCPGLYAIGEVLDVDGDCGGFNLHWAWASAMTAARAISHR